MAKHKIKLSASAFKKLHAKLKKIELANPNHTIEGWSLSSFLLANTAVDDKNDPPAIRTKRIVLQIAGDFSTNPANLDNRVRLARDLLYGADEYSLLQMRLDALVKEYKSSASVSESEANDCVKVGDCVNLVDSKIK
jgi:hypothetical protein